MGHEREMRGRLSFTKEKRRKEKKRRMNEGMYGVKYEGARRVWKIGEDMKKGRKDSYRSIVRGIWDVDHEDERVGV
jgi:hypothetical protein